MIPTTHQLVPGKAIRLAEISSRGKDFHQDRDAAEAELRKLRRRLAELQNVFYADGRFKLLVVLQAMDAGGKDGTIRKVFCGVNPQGVAVTSFKAPTHAELAHDFLWRIHQAVPAKGMIGVFNRSHYEDVLVVRVDRLMPDEVWQARYEQINQFEKLLCDTGTSVLKFFLHISREEQRRRFLARLEKPHKRWKFSLDDVAKSKKWDEYQTAYEDALNRCTTPYAPWYVIPADQKWYRNLAVARVIVAALEQLEPRYPPATDAVTAASLD